MSVVSNSIQISTSNNNNVDSKFIEEQLAFMEGDEVILVDMNDNVLGHASKKLTHITKYIKEGMLHRAFSVFLFNSKGELLLQQRAGSKITFPLYWANTCCSHPLYVPNELIEENALGVKNAALRKIDHELGINQLSIDDLIFTTKIHYEAVQDASWGEHEVDWLLFAQKDVDVEKNPSEVENIGYFNKEQLINFFKQQEEGKVLISPWFQAICENYLFQWWDRIPEILKNKALPDDIKATLKPVNYLSTPKNAISSHSFNDDVLDAAAKSILDK